MVNDPRRWKSRSGIRFGLLTIFVITTWIACATVLLLDTELLVAIASMFVIAYVLYEFVQSLSKHRPARDRFGSAVKAAIVAVALITAFVIAANSPVSQIAFRPRYNRAERARMAAIAEVLAKDERFENVELHMEEFKGFQSLYIDGSVPDAAAMQDLKELLADKWQVQQMLASVSIENVP